MLISWLDFEGALAVDITWRPRWPRRHSFSTSHLQGCCRLSTICRQGRIGVQDYHVRGICA